jgi:hypothetical protein
MGCATTTEVLTQGSKCPPCLMSQHHRLQCEQGLLPPTLLVVMGACRPVEVPQMCAVVAILGRQYIPTLGPVLCGHAGVARIVLCYQADHGVARIVLCYQADHLSGYAAGQ